MIPKVQSARGLNQSALRTKRERQLPSLPTKKVIEPCGYQCGNCAYKLFLSYPSKTEPRGHRGKKMFLGNKRLFQELLEPALSLRLYVFFLTTVRERPTVILRLHTDTAVFAGQSLPAPYNSLPRFLCPGEALA
jgi:hypothetical protein